MTKNMDKDNDNDNDIYDCKEKQGNSLVQLQKINGFHNKKNHSDICLPSKDIYSLFGFSQKQFLTQNMNANVFSLKKTELKRKGIIKEISNRQKNADSLTNKNESTIKALDPKADENIINIDNSFDDNYFDDNNLQEKILLKLNDNNYTRENLLEDLNFMINNYAKIKSFNDKEFFTKNDFDIFDKIHFKKLVFIINLLNVINVMNLLYVYTNGNTADFVNILNELKINFSYVKNNNTNNIDLVLLTPRSTAIYNYLSTHGETGIDETEIKNLARDFCTNSEKYNFDVGYHYEDLTTLHINEIMDDNNCNFCPTVMYYIKNPLKIVYNKLVNLPKGYSIDNNVVNSVYSGFNEIDLCITMKKTTKIEQNYNLCEIDENKSLINNNNKLILYEGNTYIFEIKKNVELFLDKIEHIDDVHERFIESFNNIEINRKKVYDIKNYKKIFICDHSKDQAELTISSKKVFKNKNILYMNPQVGVTAMLRMNKNLKNLNKEISNYKKQSDEKITDLLNYKKKSVEKMKKSEDEIADLKNQILELKNLFSNKFEQLNSIIEEQQKEKQQKEKELKEAKCEIMVKDSQIEEFCLVSLKSLKSYQNYLLEDVLNKYVKSKNLIPIHFSNSYDCFIKVSKQLIKTNNSAFYNSILPFINQEKDPKNNCDEWKTIEEFLVEKIKKNNVASIYYDGLYELLKGGEIIIKMNSKKKGDLKNIISFICLLEKCSWVENIENKFQAAILFLLNGLFNEKAFSFAITTNKEKNGNINIKEVIKGLISGAF